MTNESREQRELREWKEFVARSAIKSIPVPYGFTVLAVTVAGVFYVEENFESSWTEGGAAGAINGTFRLDKNTGEAVLKDPTGELLRLVISLNLQGKELKLRGDTRRWDGGWNEGDWVVLWRG